MAKDATKVRVALTGTVYVADENSTVPADITVTPSAAWADLGYTTEDGVTFSVESSTDDLGAWQSLEPLRILVTAEPKAFNFTLRQLERQSFLTAFGGTVVTVAANNYRWEPPASGSIPTKAYIVEFLDEALKYRFIYRRANQTGARELNFKRSDAVNIPVAQRVLAASPRTWEVQTNDPAFA
jgi:hypothetical protein